MATPKKRKVLNLEDRVKVIRLMESGKSSRIVAEQFGVGRTQIQQTMKRKAELLSDYENNANPESKRRRVTGNEDINVPTWRWFQDASARRAPISGPLIQEQAKIFAEEMGNTVFKASNGWLESFLKRHNIVFKTMSGERGDVDDSVCEDWKKKLPDICEGYEPKDIFNMDETGVFFRAGKRTTFVVKGSDCAGGKRSKERITVALTASMTGEKLKPLVIAKSRQPRCFKGIDSSKLPVHYKFNKKAWMNSSVFEVWIKSVDRKMKREGRKILMFIDNAPSHPKMKLDNVKLVFLPPNTTSKIQPMDQGIIQAMKLKFHKRQSRKILAEMEKHKDMCGSELLKQITVLDAIYWVKNSWDEVESSTIVKCFAKCGFKFSDSESVDSEVETPDIDEDIPLRLVSLANELFGCEFSELVEIEREIPTCDETDQFQNFYESMCMKQRQFLTIVTMNPVTVLNQFVPSMRWRTFSISLRVSLLPKDNPQC